MLLYCWYDWKHMFENPKLSLRFTVCYPRSVIFKIMFLEILFYVIDMKFCVIYSKYCKNFINIFPDFSFSNIINIKQYNK